MRLGLSLALCIALVSAASSRAEASSIVLGQPVGSVGSTTTVGIYNSLTGQVDYFNPINQDNSGVYGAKGIAADVCTNSGTGACHGVGYEQSGGTPTSGGLDVILRFTGATPGTGSLVLFFEDLDLAPINTTFIPSAHPNGFFESFRLFSGAGTALTPLINDTGDAPSGAVLTSVVIPPPGGTGSPRSNVTLTFASFIVPSTEFFLHLSFGTCSQSVNPPAGAAPAPCVADTSFERFNTVESLTATLTQDVTPGTTITLVPEPTSVLLLGSGLIALATSYRRRKKS